MVKTFNTFLVLGALQLRRINGLRAPHVGSQRRLLTKHCGTDALEAYLSCSAKTSCLDSTDCNTDEDCFEIECPTFAQGQNVTSNTTVAVNDTLAANETTATSSTISVDFIATEATNANSTSSVETDNSTSAGLNETEIASIITTNASTPAPTVTDWSNFDYEKNTKFCGPKVVGGFEVAVSQCGPLTVCGQGNITYNHFGASGNNCPKNSMCYADITCQNGPETITSTTEAAFTEATTITQTANESITASSAITNITEVTSTAATTTTSEIITTTTTQAPHSMILTTRAAFCGSSYTEAVLNCGTKTLCASSFDCTGEDECFENVSCTFDPNAEEEKDEAVTESYAQWNEEDNSAEDETSNAANGKCSSLVAGLLFALASAFF